MGFEGDDEYDDVPTGMLDDEDDDTALVPVFIGHRMQAELVRSLLEANDIPAVVFGSGGFTYGADNVGVDDRVMVRRAHVADALETIRNADVAGDEGAIVDPDADDVEDQTSDWEDDTEVEVLAGGSDWGPRIVGLIALAAFAIAILVILAQET
ncbi:MAG: DUF2007 domain-containing protein [Actinobacteria bacterium]|nr:DUF2007 domain-containing protein [Actinomycetota bacterium]